MVSGELLRDSRCLKGVHGVSITGLLDFLGVDEDQFSWHNLALCRNTGEFDPLGEEERGDLFFDTYESDPISAKAVDAMCASCPVRSECGNFAEETRQWGVWGGVYWDGAGRPDLDRNSHKTLEDWKEAARYFVFPDKTWEKIKKKFNV